MLPPYPVPKSHVLVMLALDRVLLLFPLSWLRPKLAAASLLLVLAALRQFLSLLLPTPHSVRERVYKLLLMLLRS